MEGAFTPCPTSTSVFSLREVVQFHPPSAITAMAFEPHWEALGVGSVHGFALVDLKTSKVVYKRLTHGAQFSTEPTAPSAARESSKCIHVVINTATRLDLF